jgi:hypothetical protein
MTMRTIRPVSFNDGASYVEYEYDDVDGRIYVVRGVNDSDRDMWVRVRGTADSGLASSVDYEYTFLANSGTTSWDIPPGQRKKFTLVPDGGDPGRPDYWDTLAGLTIEASG